MNKVAMLSQPMRGKTDEEIVETRNKAVQTLEAMGYEVLNTFFTDEWYDQDKMKERGVRNIPICFLAKSLEHMCCVDLVYFCEGWEAARGCRFEYEIANAYGIETLEA